GARRILAHRHRPRGRGRADASRSARDVHRDRVVAAVASARSRAESRSGSGARARTPRHAPPRERARRGAGLPLNAGAPFSSNPSQPAHSSDGYAAFAGLRCSEPHGRRLAAFSGRAGMPSSNRIASGQTLGGASMAASRARFLASAGAAIGAAALPRTVAAQTVTLPMQNGMRPLVAFPQKRPLILLTPRPPQLETPMAVFDDGVFTPNDAFFVRWHLANIPQSVDATKHRIAVTGAVQRPLSLSLDDLAAMPTVEVAAVNQCSGNSRGLFSPRVAGGQWANGAMGNARWTGVRLRDILDRAGLTANAKQVQFNGLETPVLPTTPDFKKSLDVDVARGDDVIVAYLMNGAPMPLLNGYPVRLVVPGWYATYWVKMLSDITVLDHV